MSLRRVPSGSRSTPMRCPAPSRRGGCSRGNPLADSGSPAPRRRRGRRCRRHPSAGSTRTSSRPSILRRGKPLKSPADCRTQTSPRGRGKREIGSGDVRHAGTLGEESGGAGRRVSEYDVRARGATGAASPAIGRNAPSAADPGERSHPEAVCAGVCRGDGRCLRPECARLGMWTDPVCG